MKPKKIPKRKPIVLNLMTPDQVADRIAEEVAKGEGGPSVNDPETEAILRKLGMVQGPIEPKEPQ